MDAACACSLHHCLDAGQGKSLALVFQTDRKKGCSWVTRCCLCMWCNDNWLGCFAPSDPRTPKLVSHERTCWCSHVFPKQTLQSQLGLALTYNVIYNQDDSYLLPEHIRNKVRRLNVRTIPDNMKSTRREDAKKVQEPVQPDMETHRTNYVDMILISAAHHASTALPVPGLWQLEFLMMPKRGCHTTDWFIAFHSDTHTIPRTGLPSPTPTLKIEEQAQQPKHQNSILLW